MDYELTIKPSISVALRHKVQDLLIEAGFDVHSGGTDANNSECSILFSSTEEEVTTVDSETDSPLVYGDIVDPSDQFQLSTFSIKMLYIDYLGANGLCRWLFKPQLDAVCLAAQITAHKHSRPVRILEASSNSLSYQCSGHPAGAHLYGKDMDDRYQALNGQWHWELHWDFWNLLKLFIPCVRVTIGRGIESILAGQVGQLPLWFSKDDKPYHDFELDDVKSVKGVCHAHISGLDKAVNRDAEIPLWALKYL